MENQTLMFITPGIITFIITFIGIIVIIISFYGCYGPLRKTLLLFGGIGLLYMSYQISNKLMST